MKESQLKPMLIKRSLWDGSEDEDYITVFSDNVMDRKGNVKIYRKIGWYNYSEPKEIWFGELINNWNSANGSNENNPNNL